MRKVIYHCDLCREEIKDLSNLFTIYWKSDKIPQGYVLTPVNKNDNIDKQICIDCIQMIKGIEIKKGS